MRKLTFLFVAGSFCILGSIQAAVCPSDSYTPSQESPDCIACPANAQSPANSTAFSACTCNGTYIMVGSVCEMCPVAKIPFNNVCVCKNYFDTASNGDCICKTYSKVVTSGVCGCIDSRMAMNSTGECVCPAPMKAISSWSAPTASMGGTIWPSGTGGTASGQLNKWYVRKNHVSNGFKGGMLSTWTFTTEGACTVQPYILSQQNTFDDISVPYTYARYNYGLPRTVPSAGTYTFDFADQHIIFKGKIPAASASVVVGWAVLGGDNCISVKPNGAELYQYGSYVDGISSFYDGKTSTVMYSWAVQFNAEDKSAPNPGYCLTCQAGSEYYSSNNTCSACGPNQVSVANASSCTCIPGYSMVDGVCTECPANTYCSLSVSTNCPDHAQSPPGSSLFSDCICDRKYVLNESICSVCPFNLVAVNNICACPTNMMEIDSGGSCKCKAYSATGGPDILQKCGAGTSRCPVTLYAGFGNTTAWSAYIGGAISMMNDGITSNEVTLSDPSTFQFKLDKETTIVDIQLVTGAQLIGATRDEGGEIWVGTQTMIKCATLSNLVWPAYNTITSCNGISGQYIWVVFRGAAAWIHMTEVKATSASCKCLDSRMSTDDTGTCICPAPLKAVTSWTPPQIPVSGTIWPSGTGGSATGQLNRYFVRKNWIPSKYINAKLGTWTFTTEGACTVKPYTFVQSNDNADWTIPKQYYGANVGIARTVPGAGTYTFDFDDQSTTYKGKLVNNGNGPCFGFIVTGGDNCVSSKTGGTDYFQDGTDLQNINSGLYRDQWIGPRSFAAQLNIADASVPDPGFCLSCLAGSERYSANNTCSACSPNQTSLANATSCICVAGFHMTSGNCTQCPLDNYCPDSFNVSTCPVTSVSNLGSSNINNCTCTQDSLMRVSNETKLCVCPSDSVPNGTTCICNPGKYKAGTVCNFCPANSYCASNALSTCPANTTSVAASSILEDCSGCMVGYFKTGPTACRICSAGSYCANKSSEILCSMGTSSLAGATNCTKCVANKYADANGLETCISCPLNSASAIGSMAKSSCNCNIGYYRDIDYNCITCPAGYKCTGNNLMTACGLGTAAAVGQSVCTTCLAGSYSDKLAMGACLTCPAGTIVTVASDVVLGNGGADRANHPTDSGYLYIQRKPLPSAANITKWSFYAFQACTVTPVIAETLSAVSDSGYGSISFVVKTVGTTRSVPVAGSYNYDLMQGMRYQTKTISSGGSGTYFNQNYLGWYFEGANCIPYDITAADATATTEYVVQSSTYDPATSWTNQTFTAVLSTRQNMRYSISLTSVVTASVFSSPTASTTIFNCSCGSALRQLTDGNCQGLCVDGKYMVRDTDPSCTTCPQGSACTKSIKTPCPTDQSAVAGSGQCLACLGPNTHSDVSLAMCGLKTCPATAAVAVGGTLWKGVGRITMGLGGNGIIPTTPWFAAYKCLGLVLNATADRPVSLLYQTMTVTPNQSYALRFKVVCTGVQCGAGFAVTQGSQTIYSSNTVSRSWTESATPYFTTTASTIVIQFKAQMVTSSCTLWLAQVELVDLGQWSYPSISALQLQSGAFLPVRYSASYVESQQLVPMQITGSNYLQQTATVLANNKYELVFWTQGAADALYFNGTGWSALDPQSAVDYVADWTQRVFHVTPFATDLKVRFVGPGTFSPPTLSLYTDPASRPCMNCLAGYWCKGATMNKCPLNTTSPGGSSLQTDCFCVPGYYGQVQLGVDYGYSPCAVCPMNYHCDGGNQIAPCPPGTKSQPGSALAQCVSCAPGEFCENGQVGVCPFNSYAPAGSNDVGDCGCMPGFYGVNGNCTQCESGYYCPGGPTRRSCTANAVSPPGSNDPIQCFCGRGYYGINNTACLACPEGSWCWTGIRNDCPVNTWSALMSSFQLNCTCTYGYTGPDAGPCAACSQGYYKTARGPAACTACGTGTSSTATAAVSSSVCALCNRGNFNPYVGQSSCLACEAGKSVGEFGSVSCTPCTAGGWSAAGAVSCVACVGGTFSAVASATEVGTCQTCPTGAWSSSNAVSCNECGLCPYWSWPMRVTASMTGSPLLITELKENIPNFMTLANSTHAIMSDGSVLYHLNIATGATSPLKFLAVESVSYSHVEASRSRESVYLVQSSVYRVSLPSVFSPNFDLQNAYATTGPMGATESLDGTSLWVTQSDGLAQFKIATETLMKVTAYPVGFTSVTGSPCIHSSYPDYVFMAGKASAAFGFRKFQVSTSTWSTVSTTLTSLIKCTFTPDGNFVVLTSITGTWLYSMSEDTFFKVYTGQINGVLIDPSSKFILLARQQVGVHKQAISIQDARNCGPGLYSLSSGLSSADQCATCPPGSICPSGANITQCTAGTFSSATGLRTQGQCSICPAGRYCLGGTSNQLCPLGSYSLASSVTRLADCGACPAGFYCPNTTAIVACPSNTFSPASSSDLASCTCNAGYRCEVTKVVHAEITLPITIVDFEALRQAYINAVAAAAGVDPSQVVIVSVTTKIPTGRRLLSVREFTEVHTSIYGSKHVSQPLLALVTLQRHLVIRGLPKHESNVKITLHKEVTHSMKSRLEEVR